jgi:hypothetical protein
VAIAEDDNAVLAVSEALDRLAKLDPVAAELIKLRFLPTPPADWKGATLRSKDKKDRSCLRSLSEQIFLSLRAHGRSR